MKKIYIILLTISFSNISFSQTTLIPDTNFEQKLIDLGIDTNGLTGDILNTDAQSVTTLDVSNSTISDLTGIKSFTALTSLDCSDNTLSSLNVFEINGLLTLFCNNNNLTELFFNSNLTQLLCHFNSLTHLDLRLNTGLNYLDCRNNNLYSLNLANGNNAILGTMLATTNNLTYIETDDSAGANNGTGIYAGLMWAKDSSAFYAGPLFNTYVPDDNFEQALIDLGYDSTLDNYVASSTINGVFELDISNKNISDLTGIKGFNNLTVLTCNSNNIQTLNLSHNANLTTVNANFNQIENLFVQNCTSLDYLSVESNSLTDLNVSQNTLLEELYCSSNQLNTIDTSQNTLLTDFHCSNNSLASLDVSQNTLLTVFACNQNLLTSLDVTQNTMLTSFQCSNNSLTSLDVSQNTLIFYLNSSNNLLSSLDVSQNTALNILECSTNNLTSLDVTLNVNLITLKVFTNSFEFIDLKQNTLLTQFIATNIAELSCIQVANETDANAGAGIYASWINTTGANYSVFCSDFYTYIPDNNFEQALINLGYDSTLDDYVLTSNIDFLTSLNINGESISDLTGIEDFIALEDLQCGNNNLSTLDITQNVNLLDLRCYQNSLTSLDVTQNTLLTDLRCGTNSISNLDVSQNTALTSLRVQNNSLSNLDITLNTALEILYIYNNNIAEINVDNLTNLLSFWCYENLLQRLDVTSNASLTSLRCYDNNIIALDLVQNTSLTTMNATLNTNLTCIQVLDETAAATNTGIYTAWLKDAGAAYSTNCNYPEETYIPGDNFEQALIDLGYDTVLDNFIETAIISTISTLDVSFKNISDLTGIEAFVALTDLDCRFNQLTSLDISLNTALTSLMCLNNQLTSLNVSQNVALTSLDCSNNLLTSIDVNSNADLIYFYCNNNLITSLNVTQNTELNGFNFQSNQITSIDVSQNINLVTIVCDDNLLTTLDLSANIGLRNLYCSINQITDLDLSLSPLMAYFECSSNQLTSLNVKNGINTNFLSFKALNNPNLTCINVDDTAYSTANWTDIDAQTVFSEDCSALSVDEFDLNAAVSVYPNPTSEILNINSQLTLEKLELFTVLGRKILETDTDIINMSDLQSGIYLLKIYSENNTTTKKIIKQ